MALPTARLTTPSASPVPPLHTSTMPHPCVRSVPAPPTVLTAMLGAHAFDKSDTMTIARTRMPGLGYTRRAIAGVRRA